MEYGLIGYPLKHSFSKEIHNLIKTYLHNDNYNYELCELNEEELDNFFKNREFRAINVTIPYKEKVIKYLKYLDDNAKNIGAVNTIVNINNELYGYNTDYYGLKSLLSRNEIELKDKNVLILGTGGTSKTAYQVASDMQAFKILKASRKININTLTYTEIYDQYSDVNVIINTTPAGMYPNNDESLIDFDKLNNLEAYVDVIYNPIHTKMAIQAKNKGIKTVNGLYMLISQAVYAYKYFLNIEMNEDEINNLCDYIYDDIIKSKINIALIGMPTSGKTTIGKELATLLNKEFIDTDEEIEKKIKISIKDFIDQFGEDEFRNIETEIIKEVSKQQSCIIACGGGVILREENIKALNQNSIIYFLNRSLNKLMTTKSRPLSSTKADLEKRYNERIDLYHKYADIIIDADGTIKQVTKKILEDFNG